VFYIATHQYHVFISLNKLTSHRLSHLQTNSSRKSHSPRLAEMSLPSRSPHRNPHTRTTSHLAECLAKGNSFRHRLGSAPGRTRRKMMRGYHCDRSPQPPEGTSRCGSGMPASACRTRAEEARGVFGGHRGLGSAKRGSRCTGQLACAGHWQTARCGCCRFPDRQSRRRPGRRKTCPHCASVSQ
jgi:hypothetical protein